MKRKILCIFALVLMTGLIFTGCGKNNSSPSSSATTFLEYVKADKVDDIEDIYIGGDFDPAELLFGEDVLSDQTEDMLNEKIRAFDYKLGDIDESGNIATAHVDITAYNLGAVISELQSDQSFMDSLISKDTSPFSKEANTALLNQIAQSKKTYEQSVSLSLTKNGDNWIVSNISADSDFIMAISGNLPDTLDSMLASYKKVKAEADNLKPETDGQGSNGNSGSDSNTDKPSKKIDYEIENVDDAKDVVEDYLQLDDDETNAPIIKVDSEDSDAYTVQVYSVVYNADGSTTQTTIGWFIVDKLTGKVTEK